MNIKRIQVKAVGCLVMLITISYFIAPIKGFSQDFEGIIHYTIPELKGEIGTPKLDYMIKGGMIRIEYSTDGSKKTSLLYKAQNQTMYLNISSLGGYVEVPPDDVKESIKNKTLNFDKTGITRSIAGRSCSVWKTSLAGTEYQYCFASGMGDFILPVNSMTAGSVPVWAAFKFPEQQMPLEVIRLKNGKKDKTVMQATKIEEMQLDKNLFSVLN